jgi:2-methylcitrate dehydratase
MGITQEIAKEVARANFESIPEKAVTRIRDGILDDVGIAFLGYSMGGKPLIDYATDVGIGRGESTLIGDGTKVSCVAAAGVNAQMAFDTDFNETGPGHHALSCFAQTGLAVGERVGSSGKELITAVATGYELNGRLHRAAFAMDRTGGLSSVKQIPLSVAITAAKLLNLNETQINYAIGIAWFLTSIPMAWFMSRNNWWKRIGMFHLGTCSSGVQAALLAQKGFEGPLDVLDNEPFYHLDRLKESPAPYYYVANELQLKPWISSRGVQPGTQAVLEIVAEEGLSVDDIEEIRFNAKNIYLDFPFNNPAPKEYWDAIYSVQWGFAMPLLGYEAGRDWLSSERLNDPRALALAKKVIIGEDAAATKLWEDGTANSPEAPNEVEVIAKGKTYKKRNTYADAIGSSTNPMPAEQLDNKFKAQATPVIGVNQSQKLVDILRRLEEQKDVRDIMALVSPV